MAHPMADAREALALPAEVYSEAVRAAFEVLQGAAAHQASRRNELAPAGRAGMEAPWWGAEPMKVHLDLEPTDQGSDESTYLGEPGSVGSVSPREYGVVEEAETLPTDSITIGGLALPSRGAYWHSTGQCKPCAWFWKPKGCENGQNCNHCHLCPPGELKRRKQDKVAKMIADQTSKARQATGGAGQESLSPDVAGPVAAEAPAAQTQTLEMETPWTVPLASASEFSLAALFCAMNIEEFFHPLHVEQAEEAPAVAASSSPALDSLAQAPGHGAANPVLEPPPGLDALPSKGSTLHGSGQCRPCAWFWKPQGCSNGELKHRKLQKVVAFREAGLGVSRTIETVDASAVDSESQHCPQPLQPGLQAAPPARAVTRAAATAAWPAAPDAACDAVAAPSLASALAPALHQIVPAGTAEPPKKPSAPQFSRGAAFHMTGHCQPCAWFWKPQGCANGEECTRCHLCPQGEVRRRRKAKISAMKLDAQRPAMLEESILLPQVLLD